MIEQPESRLNRLLERLRRAWIHPSVPSEVTGEIGGQQVHIPFDPGAGGVADRPMRRPAYSWTLGTQTELLVPQTRMDYQKTRALYFNRLQEYRLGAGFSRPVVNTAAGFMGVPSYSHRADDSEASAALHRTMQRNAATLYLAGRDAMRDGDSFVRLDYRADRFFPNRRSFAATLVPPDYVEPLWDPINGGLRKVTIRWPSPGDPEELGSRPFTIVETITSDEHRFDIDGEAPGEIRAQYLGRVERNEFGLIPLVQFKNEPEEGQRFGTSDLEPLDPLMRAYNDVAVMGMGGAALFAKPKLKFTVRDVDDFIRRNFPEAADNPNAKLDLRLHDVIVLRAGMPGPTGMQGEDAGFITAPSGTDAAVQLLNLLFWLIVDTSETPEFIFGTAIASSRASAESQMTPFVKKVDRKRLQFGDSFQELGQVFLAMASRVGEAPSRLDSYDVELSWPEITPRDERDLATTIKTLVDAFSGAVSAGLMSAEAASEFLRGFVPTMLAWSTEPPERRPASEQDRVATDRLFAEALQHLGPPAESQPAGQDVQAFLQRMQAQLSAGSNGRAA